MFKLNDFSSKTHTIPAIFAYFLFCFLNPTAASYFSSLRDYLLDVELTLHLPLLIPNLECDLSSAPIFWLYGQTLELISYRPEAEEPTLSNSLFLYHGFLAVFSTYASIFLSKAPTFSLEGGEDDEPSSELASSLALILGSAWSIQEVLWGGAWSWDSVETLLLLSTVLTVGSLHGTRLSASEDSGTLTLSLLFFGLSFYTSQPQFSTSIHAFTSSANDLVQTPIIVFLVSLPFWPSLFGTLQSESNDKAGQAYPALFIALCLSFALGIELSSWIPELLIAVFVLSYSYRTSILPIWDVRFFTLSCKLRIKKIGLYLHLLVVILFFNIVAFSIQPYGQPINNNLSGFDLTFNKIDIFWTAEDGCFGRGNTTFELGIYNDSIFDVMRFLPLVHGSYVSVWLLNQVSVWPIYFLYPSFFIILFRAKSRHFPCLIIFYLFIDFELRPHFLTISYFALTWNPNIMPQPSHLHSYLSLQIAKVWLVH